jgi:hypothetical protein
MQPAKEYLTREVYGISRELPLNYVDREKVDNLFVEAISKDKIIVVHGSSKQGKTSLRKRWLIEDKDYILIQCSNKWKLGDLFAKVLKSAGFRLEGATTSRLETSGKLEGKIDVGLFGKGVSATVEGDVKKSTESLSQKISVDINDVGDIISALKETGFSKFIVLEDFHYLEKDVQSDFSIALKNFYENSKVIFIIVGIWVEQDRLIAYNGDLAGRVIPISVDIWNRNDLSKVIHAGEALLNISFSQQIFDDVIQYCNESVYILQESCYRICEKLGIGKTQKEMREIKDGINVQDIVKDIVNLQSSRYMSFFTHFDAGFQKTELAMYKWILYTLLKSSETQLSKGLTLNEIYQLIISKHPKGSELNQGNLTQALQNVSNLQIQKNIQPLVIDYDNTNLKLNVVDNGFLIWMKYQDVNSILNQFSLPLD